MYDESFHQSIQNEELPQAVRLAYYIAEHIKPKAFADFGCSTGLYVKEVQKRLPDIYTVGFEFSEEGVKIANCNNVIKYDLRDPIYLNSRPDTLGMCLEVLEHIEEKDCKPVLENITRNCNRVIFSAAPPWQPGTGHINCQTKLYWIKRFYELGWIVDIDATNHILNWMTANNGYHMGWFANNAMVLIPYKS